MTNKIYNNPKINQYFIVEQYNSIDDCNLAILISTHLSAIPVNYIKIMGLYIKDI